MAKKIIKKKKLKVFRLLLILIILGAFFFGTYEYLNTKTKNIIITGTTYLKDDYILSLAKLENYPSFYRTTSLSIKKKLEKSPYIKTVKVKKSFYHVITIQIKENEPLFIVDSSQKLVLENNQEIELDSEISLFRVPRLMNYVPNTKYNNFKKNLAKIDSSILGKVSEITYLPNEFDKDRFLLYMDDGNSVYLTLTKFKMLNYYNKVLNQLDGKKGILYLDSGNHFKIMG